MPRLPHTFLLRATLLSLLSLSEAQLNVNTSCPSSVQNYNASGLLGFFDSTVSQQIIPSESTKPTIDTDGYLYNTNSSAAAPPASFAYALTVSSDDSNPPSILSTLFLTLPVNQTRNATAQSKSNDTTTTGWACALSIFDLPVHTTRLGQKDDGTCTSTLPHSCASKILNNVAEHKMLWPNDPDPDLQGVCSAYSKVLELALNEKATTKTDLTHECTKLFLSTSEDTTTTSSTLEEGTFLPQVNGLALTADDDTINNNVSGYHPSLNPDLPWQCNDLPIVQNTLGAQFPAAYPMTNVTTTVTNTSDVNSGSLEQSYDEATRQVVPIITLLLRGPDNLGGLAGQEIEVLSAHMGCLRTTSFSANSRVSPELKPVKKGKAWNDGPIAGLVVGVFFALALFAAVTWFLKRRKHKREMMRRSAEYRMEEMTRRG